MQAEQVDGDLPTINMMGFFINYLSRLIVKTVVMNSAKHCYESDFSCILVNHLIRLAAFGS